MKIFSTFSSLLCICFCVKLSNSEYLKSWRSLENFVSSYVKQLVNSSPVETFRNSLVKNELISENCSQGITHYIDSIANMDYWAVKMFDSSGKIPSGLLEGTLNDMGSYDECLEISNASYCMIDLKIEMPDRDPYHSIGSLVGHKFIDYSKKGKVFHHMSQMNAHYFHYLFYRLGVCLPSICSENDIKLLITSELRRLDIGLHLQRIQCQVRETFMDKFNDMNIYQMLSMSYMSILILLLIIGSLNHWFGDRKSILESFSVQNNLKRLLNVENQNQSLTCLQGMRLFSISWVILGHCYGWISFQIFRRSFAATDILTSIWFLPIINGSLAVDTFFLMSGLLTFHLAVKHFEVNQTFNITVYLLHRIWRFLPHLLLTLSLTFLVPLIGSGPIWKEVIEPTVKSCEQNWWTNVLFINHLVNSDNICLLHTWYLGCDLHFYILSLLVIIPFIKSYKRLSALNISLFIIIGTISTAVILGVNQYPPTLLYGQPKVEERLSYVLQFYIKPYSHFGSYGLGLLLALLITAIKDSPKRKHFLLSKNQLTIGWIVSIITVIIVMFSIYPWNKGETPHPITSIIYGSLHRTLWSAAMSWVIFVCVSGNGGLVNSILSCKPLIPLSRITFSVYLVHPIVHWMKLGSIRERIAVNHYDGLYAFIPTLFLSFIFGLICSLLCESPLLAIEKKILNKVFDNKTSKRDEVLKQSLSHQMISICSDS